MRFAKKTDIIIIGCILLFGIVFWGIYQSVYAKSGTYAQIYYHSQLVETVDLTSTEEYSFFIAQEPEVVFYVYGDGSIAFVSSNCPDKVCVHAGKLNRVGQYAACLPNKMYIKIVSDEAEDPDAADIIIG